MKGFFFILLTSLFLVNYVKGIFLVNIFFAKRSLKIFMFNILIYFCSIKLVGFKNKTTNYLSEREISSYLSF